MFVELKDMSDIPRTDEKKYILMNQEGEKVLFDYAVDVREALGAKDPETGISIFTVPEVSTIIRKKVDTAAPETKKTQEDASEVKAKVKGKVKRKRRKRVSEKPSEPEENAEAREEGVTDIEEDPAEEE